MICRLTSVLLIVEAAKNLSFSGLNSPYWSEISGALVYLVLTVGGPLVAAVVIWVSAEKLCQFESVDSSGDGLHTLSAGDLFAIGVTLIGLYALLFGIIGAIRIETMAALDFFRTAEDREYTTLVETGYWAARASYLPRIILGMFLILGRRRIAQFLVKARYSGTGV